MLCVFVVWTVFFSLASCETHVRLAGGASLIGQALRSRDGRTYYSYTGIPYAKPPVGELRFKAPQPADPWTGILNATGEPNKCVQKEGGQEDCLYLNVYSPKVGEKKEKLLPVMFWIHGGSFIMGHGGPSEFGPEFFMDKDVVLVTINYRLGLFGFLSTEDDAIPGNFGMKDQVVALRWVRDNAAAFHGDPGRVTVVGESAGSVCTGLHVLSPASKGLFHRAVLQSGVPTCLWAVQPPGLARKRAHAIATIAGCNENGSADVLKCLRKIPADLLVDVQDKLVAWSNFPAVLFGAVVENCIDSGKEDAFLCNHPIYNFKQESFVPVIIGLNSAEGGVLVSPLYNCTSLARPELRTDFNRLLSIMMQYNHYTRPEDLDEIGERIFEKYFPPGHHLDENSYSQMTDIVSDGFFTQCIVDMARLLKSPVYGYVYDHRNEYSDNFLCQKYLGVGHGDDLLSLFSSVSRANNTWNARDLEVSKLMVDVWYRFVSSDFPTIDGTDGGAAWPEFSSNKTSSFLHIGSPRPKIIPNPFEEKYEFWSRLFQRFCQISFASQQSPHKKIVEENPLNL